MTDLRSLQRDLARALTQRDGSLPNVSSQEIARSRETLVRKRLAQIRFSLPRTSELLGANMSDLFRSYASAGHIDGPFAWAHDCIAFSRWLSKQTVAPEWIGDLARWEAVPAQWYVARYFCRWHTYIFDIPRWYADRREPPRRRTNVWITLRCGSRFVHQRIW